MSKNTQDKEDKSWTIQLGVYPGVVFGFRTYNNEDSTIHVLYMPFFDVAVIIDK